MLAYDIETTGLDPDEGAEVTVVSFYSKDGAVTLNFLHEEDKPLSEKRRIIMEMLDNAQYITTFNGVRFDTPFIQRYFDFDADKVGCWIAKTFDIWEICYNLLDCRFSLKETLAVNGLQGKSGTGLEAIQWARQSKMWPRLEEYCADDARLTYLLAFKSPIILPERHKQGIIGYVISTNPDAGWSFSIDKFDFSHEIVRNHWQRGKSDYNSVYNTFGSLLE
jgi:hypothetical protein